MKQNHKYQRWRFSRHFYVFHLFSWSWIDRINWPFCSESFHLSCCHTPLVGNSFWQRSAQLRLNWATGRKEEGGKREHNLETMRTHFSIFCTHWSLSCPPAGRRTAGGPLTTKISAFSHVFTVRNSNHFCIASISRGLCQKQRQN